MNEIRQKRLFDALIAQMDDNLVETLLDLAADYEYRICILELGI